MRRIFSRPPAFTPEHADRWDASQWRWSLIGMWFAMTCLTFVAMSSLGLRSWVLLPVFGMIPPAMLLWLWNEDRPMLLGSLSTRPGQP